MASQQEVQNTLAQAQAYQQQIQSILLQKENITLQLNEIKKALDELSKTAETEIYKMSGPILIKTSKSAVKKELMEKQELLSMKMKTLERGEKKTKGKLDELKQSLTQEMGG